MKEVNETAENLGLYLSVPFCRAKCSFCNFASGVGSAEAMQRYVATLCEEIGAARELAASLGAELPESVDTVYFGGGTPSLLAPEQLRSIFAALRGEFRLETDAEITLEAAPGQIEDYLMEAALALGVNRISLGVQSFVDREAQAVGRSHTEASCREEFRRLRSHGVRNLGVDLIAGLPLQNEASWRRSVEVATGCGLDHLSVYMLEIDEDSRLGLEVLNGGARLHAPAVPGEDLTAALYELACEQLPAAGYGQYEISNFAANGRASRHNLKYWWREPYLGLGLDAHSMLHGAEGAVRWANPEALREYAGARSCREPRSITAREAFEEEVFLGLRLCAGLDRRRLQGYPDAWRRELEEAAAELAREGWMGSDDGRLWLMPKGRLISSTVFGNLLAGVTA